jgi:hypothetical protein
VGLEVYGRARPDGGAGTVGEKHGCLLVAVPLTEQHPRQRECRSSGCSSRSLRPARAWATRHPLESEPAHGGHN